MRILFVSSEVFPFAKTGGLPDVSASLPRALQAIGHQVCVLMPAYRGVLGAAQPRGVRLRHANALRRGSKALATIAEHPKRQFTSISIHLQWPRRARSL